MKNFLLPLALLAGSVCLPAEMFADPVTISNFGQLQDLASKTDVVGDFDVTVVYVNGSSTYLIDREGNPCSFGYKTLSNVKVGSIINAGWSGNWRKASNNINYIRMPQNVVVSEKTADVSYRHVGLDYITKENQNAVVVLENVTFEQPTPDDSGTYGTETFEGTCEGQQIFLLNKFKTPGVPAGTYDVTCAVAAYTFNDNIKDVMVSIFPIGYSVHVDAATASSPYGEIADGQTVRIPGLYDDVEICFTTSQPDGKIMYTFQPKDGNPEGPVEVPEDGVVKFTEDGTVSYYVETPAGDKSEVRSFEIVFNEAETVTVEAFHNGDPVNDNSPVELAPGESTIEITFITDPENASVFYRFVPEEASGEYPFLPAENKTASFTESGKVTYYATTEDGISEYYFFDVNYVKQITNPISIAAYYNNDLIADGATIAPAPGEDSVTVKFECDNEEAVMLYSVYPVGSHPKSFYPVPEEGEITFKSNCSVSYYAEVADFCCPAFHFTVEGISGIVSAATSEGTSTFFDLQGCAVSGQLQPGIYVEVKDGKATKIIVRK